MRQFNLTHLVVVTMSVLAWTGCIVLSVLLNVVLMGMGAAGIEMPPIE